MLVKNMNLVKFNFLEELRPFKTIFRVHFSRRYAGARKISFVWVTPFKYLKNKKDLNLLTNSMSNNIT